MSEISGKNTSIFTFIDFSFSKSEGQLTSSDPYLMFIQKLHESFDRSCLAARVEKKDIKGSYQWPANLGFYPLHHRNTFQLFTTGIGNLPKNIKLLQEAVSSYDQILLCWPHPISFLIAKNFAKHKKVFLLIRQNQVAITKSKYQGWKRIFALNGLRLLENQLEKLKMNVQVITVGDEMNKYYLQRNFRSNLIVDSLISKSCKGTPKELEKQNLRLLFVGRIEKEKGVDILLNACSILRDQYPNFHLQIIGNGNQFLPMKALASQLGLENWVSFRDHVKHGEELFHCFQNADLLVIPSRTEGFPKIIHEARAFGLPVVATPVGGMFIELTHGVNIWFAERVDEKALAAAIIEILENKNAYSLISNNLLKEFDCNTIENAIDNYANHLVS